jgi:uncharacterized RDD family membrane protein YckC
MSPAPALVPSACPNHPEITTGLEGCARCGKTYCADCLVPLQGKPYCATCKDEQLRDLRSGAAEADLAGLGKRFVGAFVDGLVVGIPTLAILFGVMGMSAVGGSASSQFFLGALAGLASLVYEGVMLQMRGQTVGKIVAGTKVVTPEGNDITPAQAWMRAGSRFIMALTRILGLVDVLMIFGAQRKTLHDRIAKTVVVNWQR